MKMSSDFAHRERIIVERLLEDERLTANLDDAAATILLDWGVQQTKGIVADTEGLSDEEAEAAMYPRMRGLKTVIRYANNWFGKRGTADIEENMQLIEKIVVKTAVIHPDTFTPADEAEQRLFAQETNARNDQTQLVNIFCAWIDLQTKETASRTSEVPQIPVEDAQINEEEIEQTSLRSRILDMYRTKPIKASRQDTHIPEKREHGDSNE